MRFHIGFSKRISKKTIIFLLGLLSLAFAMFFGNTEIVNAEIKVVAPSSVYYKSNTVSPYQITPSVSTSGDLYVYNPNNSGSAAFDFTNVYNFSSVCSTGRGSIEFQQYGMYSTDGGGLVSGYFNIRYNDNSDIGSYQITSSTGNWYYLKTGIIDLTKAVRITMNTSSGYNVNAVYYSKNIDVNCVSDGSAAIIDNQTQNTQDIMNNDNQNTQTIVDSFSQNTQDLIDNQNDDNVSTANSTSSNFFNNFHIDDTRGLTSVITAPIRLLQGIINSNDSCDPYTFTIQILGTDSKTVSLPSGCILWNNVPNLVVVSYWVIVWAIVGYRCLVDMIHFTSALRDPDHKNDYTLDL